jgi:hypothetical protein
MKQVLGFNFANSNALFVVDFVKSILDKLLEPIFINVFQVINPEPLKKSQFNSDKMGR